MQGSAPSCALGEVLAATATATSTTSDVNAMIAYGSSAMII